MANNHIIEHKCPRCKYSSTQKCNLIRHLKRETVCEPIFSNVSVEELLSNLEFKPLHEKQYECTWCQTKYSSKSNLCTHKKTCKRKPVAIETGPTSSNHVQEQTNTIVQVPEEASNSDLRSLLQELIVKMNNTSQSPTIIINNITNNNTININCFGDEKRDHITLDKMIEYIKNRGLVDLIKDINFNPDVPENHNIKRVTGSQDWYKNQWLAVYKSNGEWSKDVKEEVLQGILMNGMKVMMNHLTSDQNNIALNETIALTQWFNSLSTKSTKNMMKKIFSYTLRDDFYLPNEKRD